LRRPEQILHQQVAAYLRVALVSGPAVWTTFPAGGGGRVRGAQLRASGLRAGWPDIQIMWKERSRTAFVAIELKSKVGRLSPEQRECHDAIRLAGGLVYVCRSVLDVQAALVALNAPLRARVAA